MPSTHAESVVLAKIRPAGLNLETHCQLEQVEQIVKQLQFVFVLTMSVAFLQLFTQPEDRFDPHFCAKVPVKGAGGSTLIKGNLLY